MSDINDWLDARFQRAADHDIAECKLMARDDQMRRGEWKHIAAFQRWALSAGYDEQTVRRLFYESSCRIDSELGVSDGWVNDKASIAAMLKAAMR